MTTDSERSKKDPKARSAPDQKSQIEIFWNSFKNNRLSLIGGTLIIVIVLIAIAAPVVSPHSPTKQFRPEPGSNAHNPLSPGTSISSDHGTTTFFLGTDQLGRDILSRTLYGIRTMLFSVLLIIGIATLLAIPIGSISGYYGGSWIDEITMRIMDILLSFPSIILAIALVGATGQSSIHLFTLFGVNIALTNQFKVIIVLVIVYTPRLSRVMRSEVLKEVEEEYVSAAKAAGGSVPYILTREIFPNTISPVVVQATLYMGYAVLAIAGLSFLGVGVQPPTASLGLMLNNARDYVYNGAWWFSLVPGLVIVISILSFNLLGDGLRDTFDPEGEETRTD